MGKSSCKPWTGKRKLHRIVIKFNYDFIKACEIVDILYKTGTVKGPATNNITLIYEKEGRCMLNGKPIRQFDITGIEDDTYNELISALNLRQITWEDVS